MARILLSVYFIAVLITISFIEIVGGLRLVSYLTYLFIIILEHGKVGL